MNEFMAYTTFHRQHYHHHLSLLLLSSCKSSSFPTNRTIPPRCPRGRPPVQASNTDRQHDFGHFYQPIYSDITTSTVSTPNTLNLHNPPKETAPKSSASSTRTTHPCPKAKLNYQIQQPSKWDNVLPTLELLHNQYHPRHRFTISATSVTHFSPRLAL